MHDNAVSAVSNYVFSISYFSEPVASFFISDGVWNYVGSRIRVEKNVGPTTDRSLILGLNRLELIIFTVIHCNLRSEMAPTRIRVLGWHTVVLLVISKASVGIPPTFHGVSPAPGGAFGGGAR